MNSGNTTRAGDPARPPRGITWGPELAAPAEIFQCIDTLHYGLHVRWKEKSALFDAFEQGKSLAQEKDQEVPFYFGACDANIHPTGRRGGFRWHLSFADISLFFSIRNEESQTPNVWVEIGSVSCWTYGLVDALAQVLQYVQNLYGEVVDSSISRVDMAADYVGLPFEETGIEDKNRWIRQTRRFGLDGTGTRITSMSVGKGGALMLRVYDKAEELKNRQGKREFFYPLWGLDENDKETPVTRTEFQFRRDVLREFGIRDIPSLLKKLQGLWKYATTKWFRLAKTVPDRKNRHQDTAEIDPWWEHVQSLDWPGQMAKRERIAPHGSPSQLLQQAVGCVMKVAAIESYQDDRLLRDPVERLITSMNIIFGHYVEKMARQPGDFTARYHRKLSDVWAFKHSRHLCAT